VTQDGLAITSFRLASSTRRFDRATSRWVDGETNWYTVTAFKDLATNANASIHKGDRIMLTGKLRVRDWDNGERSGTSVEIEAEAMGHDLTWGNSEFTRNVLVRPEATPADAPADVVAEEVKPVKPSHTCNCGNCSKKENN
jgi:single-strand DNA-binding protein